ncbi:ATPase V1 complex subunit C, partial [Sistotremastrum niveocremeum HHB9708]
MPSDQSTWLIAVPQDGDSEGLVQELSSKLGGSKSIGVGTLNVPSFKTGTLDSLVSLSEELPKQDAYFTSVVAKIVDTLRNLLNNESAKVSQHILVNEQPVDDYLFGRYTGGWKWNEGRYGVQKGLRELAEVLNKELTSIDNVTKLKLNNYNLAKGSLVQLQRKQTGNLSVRNLSEIVSKEHFIQDSEYLETVLVAIPNNNVKDWSAKYERLASMVVPRSSVTITSDSDFTLFAVVIFRRCRDEFAQKCRENRFIIRDFTFTDDQLVKHQEELSSAEEAERELWTELLRLSRTNFSEAFQLLVHLKVMRLFVESVLRYGLPSNYTGVIIKPDPKLAKKTLSTLSSQFAYLAPRANAAPARSKKKQETTDDFAGEYQQIMEQEFFDFALFEVPWII